MGLGQFTCITGNDVATNAFCEHYFERMLSNYKNQDGTKAHYNET